MTQQSPLSAHSGHQPGQMTAVMRAVATSGPKVLRIGLVQGGRVVEERIIKQRGDVTVGSSEKNMFVIPSGDLPSSYTLFELKDKAYHLNFTTGMQGRLALQTGLSDLEVVRGQAKPSSQGGHQVPLTDDSRGKVVIGDTTLLFQFVAPPPIQPKPQLPVSVTRGAASVDWPTTVIAAFSFLIHFCAIGAIYSDWLDPVVDYDINVGALVETVKSLPSPPPVEEPTPDAPAEESAEQKAQAPEPKKSKPAPQATPAPKEGSTQSLSKEQVAQISNELESLEMATLAALSGGGPATANVLRSGEVPTSALDAAAASEAGVSSADPGGLKLGGAGGTVRPGAAGGGLASIGKSSKTGGSGSGKTAQVKGPRGSASVGGASVAGGSVGNASRAVAGMRAGFRACYNRGLQSNPDIEGKIQLSIKVGPGGQVLGVQAKKKGNIPADVLACVKARAKSGRFDPPQGGAAVVQVPVSFVRQ